MKKLSILAILLFVLICGVNAQERAITETADAIKSDLNFLWNNFGAFVVYETNEDWSRPQQGGFYGLTTPELYPNAHAYLLIGRNQHLIIIFFPLSTVDGLVRNLNPVFLQTNNANRRTLQRYIDRWKEVNRIRGDFF